MAVKMRYNEAAGENDRGGETMRLLLAEDERSLSRAVKTILEKSNYSVDAVYDGEDALAYLEAGCYDAVSAFLDRWIDDGAAVTAVDAALCGYAMLKLYQRRGGERYRAAAEKRSEAVASSAKELGADFMVTACPLCLYNLTKHARTEIPVRYFTDVLAEAMGLKEPKESEGEK